MLRVIDNVSAAALATGIPRQATLGALAAMLLTMTGCASDAWKPNPQVSTFMNQVERVCGTTRIGELTVSQLLNPASQTQSAYFVDMTSRLDNNKITREEFALGVSSTFNTVRDSAGIRCILEQKPQQ